MPQTHVVFNQVPPLVDYDAADIPVLLEALEREGAGWAAPELHELGRLAGSAEAQEWGRLAEAHPPELLTHDTMGNRIDEVRYDPAYHRLMETAVGAGLHGAPWRDDRPGAHVARAAKFMVWTTADAGHGCPISMTYSAVAALRLAPELAARYEPLLASPTYDPRTVPATEKAGIIAGMSMTEKQGGSDVRANTTEAASTGDGAVSLTGHKWFTSAPMSDVFLVLAQAPGGLSCYLVPRVLPDGTRNAIHLQRLKDKLGNKSNASGEIEYDGALGWLVGEEGRGVRTIVEMVNSTRLDCTIGAAAGMQIGLARAMHFAMHRKAFGRELVDQPLMANVLADLAIEAEAATLLALRLAGASDRAVRGDEREGLLRRLVLPAAKYHTTKRGPVHAAETLECFGGSGYVEESGMPKLFREAPVLSVWEGSGNVAALDVLRAMAREPHAVDVFFDEVGLAAGADRRLDAAVEDLRAQLADASSLEVRARRVAESIAQVLAGSLLVRSGNSAVADAYCASRLGGDWGHAFGTLPVGTDTGAIMERAKPKPV